MLVVGIKVQPGGSPGEQFGGKFAGVRDADRVLALGRLRGNQARVEILRHLLLHQLDHSTEPCRGDDGHDARKDAHGGAGFAREGHEVQVLLRVEEQLGDGEVCTGRFLREQGIEILLNRAGAGMSVREGCNSDRDLLTA